MTRLLKGLDYLELVLRINLCESVRFLAEPYELVALSPLQFICRVNLRPYAEYFRYLPCYRYVIAGYHLDPYPVPLEELDSAGGVVPRRVKEWYQPDEPPAVAKIHCHAEGPVALSGEFINLLHDLLSELLIGIHHVEYDLRCTFRRPESLSIAFNLCLGVLYHGVKGDELHLFAGLEPVLSLNGSQNREVYRVLVLLLARQCRVEEHIIDAEAVPRDWVVNGQLVLGEGSSLVGAEGVHGRELFNCHELRYYCLPLCKFVGPYGHCDAQHSWQRRGDCRNREDEGEA